MTFFRKNDAENAYVDGFGEREAEDFPAFTDTERKKESGGLEMTVMNPNDFSEVTDISKEILRGVTVVLNIDRLSKETSRRVLDFLGGVIYAINGGVKKVAAGTYILTPQNVDLYDSTAAAAPTVAPETKATAETVPSVFAPPVPEAPEADSELTREYIGGFPDEIR